MPIADSELIFRKAATVSDTPAQNGGRMGATMTTGVKNNLFPDVPQAERASGSTKYRKFFLHVSSAEDIALIDVKVYLSAPTAAADYVTLYPGTQTDTQDAIAGRPYGVASLYVQADALDATIQIVGENQTDYGTLQPFRVGDLIRVANGGQEEWHEIASVDYQPAYIGLGLAGAIAQTFDVSGTVVSSVIESASVLAAVSGVSKVSTNGFIDDTDLLAHNKGGVQDTWTLTFTGATTFTAAGLLTGALSGSGSTLADYAPNNPDTSSPYFTVPSIAWSGTWAAGDTMTFSTAPAAVPVWARRDVPAGAASLAGNAANIGAAGESA